MLKLFPKPGQDYNRGLDCVQTTTANTWLCFSGRNNLQKKKKIQPYWRCDEHGEMYFHAWLEGVITVCWFTINTGSATLQIPMRATSTSQLLLQASSLFIVFNIIHKTVTVDEKGSNSQARFHFGNTYQQWTGTTSICFSSEAHLSSSFFLIPVAA